MEKRLNEEKINSNNLFSMFNMRSDWRLFCD